MQFNQLKSRDVETQTEEENKDGMVDYPGLRQQVENINLNIIDLAEVMNQIDD